MPTHDRYKLHQTSSTILQGTLGIDFILPLPLVHIPWQKLCDKGVDHPLAINAGILIQQWQDVHTLMILGRSHHADLMLRRILGFLVPFQRYLHGIVIVLGGRLKPVTQDLPGIVLGGRFEDPTQPGVASHLVDSSKGTSASRLEQLHHVWVVAAHKIHTCEPFGFWFNLSSVICVCVVPPGSAFPIRGVVMQSLWNSKNYIIQSNLIHQLSSIYGPDKSPSCPHVAHPHLIPTHIYSCPIPIGSSPIHWSTFSQLVQKLGLIAGLLQLGHGGRGDLHLPQICQVLRTESRGQWPGTVQHQLRIRSLGRNADLTWE